MPKLVDHTARRFEICGIAASLIARGGLEAATFREIARESGYSKGVIEHYFESKGELIDGALTWANSQYEVRVAESTRNLSGISALRNRLAAIVPLSKSTRDEWKVRLVFWSMAAIDPKLRRKQQQRSNLAVEQFEGDLLTAIANREIAADTDTKTLARHLFTQTIGISTAALHDHSLYTRDFLLEEIDTLVRNNLQQSG